LETGPNLPEKVHAVIECLKRECNKYEHDKNNPCRPRPGAILERPLPLDYGFTPQSYYDDEDPFDVLVLVEEQTFSGCAIEARPVALIKMDDDGEQDDKVVAVPSEDPRWDHVEDLEDITQRQLDEIEEFFETYKNLEADKEAETQGWEDRRAAYNAIEHAQDLYAEHFG